MNNIIYAQRAVFKILIPLILVLISWGGHVHNTDSSLACPDWPLCFGQFMPEMKGNVFIEHGHRLIATLVGFFVVLLNILEWFTKDTDKIKRKHFTYLLAMVVFQGVLGGITVLYKLPPLVSTAHLTLSLIFLSSIVASYTYYFKPKLNINSSREQIEYERFLMFVIGSVLLQSMLGALMRHLGAGVACGVGYDSLFLCMQFSGQTFWPEGMSSQLHMLHRLSAVIIFLGISFFVFKSSRWKDKHKKIARGIFLAIVWQISLGLMVVYSGISVLPTTLHLFTPALILAISVYSLFENHSSNFSLRHPYIQYVKDFVLLGKLQLTSLVVLSLVVGVLVSDQSLSLLSYLELIFITFLLVTSSCLLNCWLEKDQDAKMERTAKRTDAIDRIGKKKLLTVGLFSLTFSIYLLATHFNFYGATLALMASLIYLLAYTPLKTKSLWSLFIGAISGAIPPLLGQLSVQGYINQEGMFLFILMVIWQIPHFLSISLYRKEDYTVASFLILPSVKGNKSTQYIILIFSILLFVMAYYPIRNEQYFSISALTFMVAIIPVILAIIGIIKGSSDVIAAKWARTYFFTTLLYLPVMFIIHVFSVVKEQAFL